MRRALKIGIDGRLLDIRPRGIGRYIWELCKALDVVLSRAEFYVYSRDPTGLARISSRWYERVEQGFARKLPKSLWAVTRPGFMARRDGVDVFWGGTGLLPLIGLSARSVLSVHDLVHKVMPEVMSRRGRLAMSLFFERSLMQADTILTNSQGTATRLRELTGYEASGVVRPGVSSMFTRQSEAKVTELLGRHLLCRPYVLGVATLEPRKGLDLLVRAFCSLQSRRELSQYTLVVAGGRGWRDRGLSRLMNSTSPRINWLGFVEDEELVTLYSGCDAFVYPSKYEGFGIPVLEARACGARVVTSDSPELREAGGTDALYVAPTEAGISQGLIIALNSNRSSRIDRRKQSWIASSITLARALAGEDLSEIALAE